MAVAAERSESGSTRLTALDVLRGAIMVVMALDHANLFIARQHPRPEMWTGPLPVYGSALAFFTRVVTHLAAPGFFFLMGVSMVLFADSRRKLGWTMGSIVRHLIARGLVLILLQFWVEDPAWSLASAGRPMLPGTDGPVYVGVLYGLGAAMIAGSLLLQAGTGWLLGISAASVLATQVLIPAAIQPYVPVAPVLRLLLVPGQTGNILVYYPMIPWLGLMGFGLVFGRWILQDHDRAYRRAALLGLVFLALFVGVRAVGGWGNIRPAPGSGWMAFFNVVKYPPSLAFIFLTLGVDLVLLAALAHVSGRAGFHPLSVFGSSPLFFYVAHLYLYGILGLTFGPKGTGLGPMYLLWLAGLVILYPLCRAFSRFKQQRPSDSLWRFL